MALAGLWPQIESKYVEQLIFELTYQQHGGSGLTWTRGDVLNMDFETAHQAIDMLAERRTKEAQAIKQAQKKR